MSLTDLLGQILPPYVSVLAVPRPEASQGWAGSPRAGQAKIWTYLDLRMSHARCTLHFRISLVSTEERARRRTFAAAACRGPGPGPPPARLQELAGRLEQPDLLARARATTNQGLLVFRYHQNTGLLRDKVKFSFDGEQLPANDGACHDSPSAGPPVENRK